jgi:hypothetical protein
LIEARWKEKGKEVEKGASRYEEDRSEMDSFGGCEKEEETRKKIMG